MGNPNHYVESGTNQFTHENTTFIAYLRYKNVVLDLYFLYRCITTKHGYQSKRTYGKVVRKQKMDSYIVG